MSPRLKRRGGFIYEGLSGRPEVFTCNPFYAEVGEDFLTAKNFPIDFLWQGWIIAGIARNNLCKY
jgi:hypothetical protein